MSLDSAFKRLEEVTNRLTKRIEKHTQAQQPAIELENKAVTANAQAAQDAAAATLRPIVRGMMLGNLRAAGLGRVTGALERAVGMCEVWVSRPKSKAGNVIAGKQRLMVGFAAKMTAKSLGSQLRRGKLVPKTQKKATSVYTYGSALNYGAVRQQAGNNVLKAAGKRNLKRAIFERKITKRKAENLRKQDVNIFQGKVGSKAVKAGNGTTIIKPRHFFQLTPTQARYIAGLFQKLVAKKMAASSKPAAAAA